MKKQKIKELNKFMASKGYILHKGSSSDKWEEKIASYSDIYYISKDSANINSRYLGEIKEDNVYFRLWFDIPIKVTFQMGTLWGSGIIIDQDWCIVTKPEEFINLDKIKEFISKINLEKLKKEYPPLKT